jgi:predicted acetyltransferase
MEFIYLTCDESNIASYKTIEKIGAELVEICDVPKKYFGWSEVWRAKGFINSI